MEVRAFPCEFDHPAADGRKGGGGDIACNRMPVFTQRCSPGKFTRKRRSALVVIRSSPGPDCRDLSDSCDSAAR